MNDSIKVIDNNVEVITLDLIREITDYQKNYKDGAVNIAVRTDETIETVMERKPLKKLSDRIMLAKSIKGVDSVTVVDNKGVLAFEPTSDDLNSAHIKKKYKVGYVPGTFDIVHPGHLEIIKIATMYCEKVVVGINADNLVWENKKKKCMQNESTRMFIMRHIKGVEHVILVEENDKCKANEIIKMLTGEEIGCIFYGEDLRAKKELNDAGMEGLNCDSKYTSRPPEKMAINSTSTERAQLQQLIAENEKLKNENSALHETLNKREAFISSIKQQVTEDDIEDEKSLM